MRYEEAKRREGLRFRTAYLKGWDSVLIHPPYGDGNPYHRQDYRRTFERGRQDCLANKPLPEAYRRKPL